MQSESDPGGPCAEIVIVSLLGVWLFFISVDAVLLDMHYNLSLSHNLHEIISRSSCSLASPSSRAARRRGSRATAVSWTLPCLHGPGKQRRQGSQLA